MLSKEHCLEFKGVIPNLVGGLGNQLFITAAAHVVFRTQGFPLYYPQNPLTYKVANQHNRLSQDYKDTVFKWFGVRTQWSLTDMDELYKQGYKKISPKGFAKWNPEDIKEGTIMDSYFQYYPVLEPYEEELRMLIQMGLKSNIETVRAKYNLEHSAFLHVRRGDYLNTPNYHYIQSVEEYYDPAVKLLRERLGPEHIYVCTDDREWVKSQPFFSDSIFTLVDLPNELDTLALMSQCKYGAICGNSTFSWWGVFLGAYGERAPVIVPKKWIGEPIEYLFPKEWIII